MIKNFVIKLRNALMHFKITFLLKRHTYYTTLHKHESNLCSVFRSITLHLTFRLHEYIIEEVSKCIDKRMQLNIFGHISFATKSVAYRSPKKAMLNMHVGAFR